MLLAITYYPLFQHRDTRNGVVGFMFRNGCWANLCGEEPSKAIPLGGDPLNHFSRVQDVLLGILGHHSEDGIPSGLHGKGIALICGQHGNSKAIVDGLSLFTISSLFVMYH